MLVETFERLEPKTINKKKNLKKLLSGCVEMYRVLAES